MSAGFTPGPWHRGTSLRFRNEIMDETGLAVADVREFVPRYRSASDANGALISAAPELFMALTQLLTASESRIFGDECLQERLSARLALAQARGDA